MKVQKILGVLLLAAIATACTRHDQNQPAPRESREATLTPMGEALFNERCRDCHKFGVKGGKTGPDLTEIAAKRDRDYLQKVIKEPSKVYPGTVMPPGDNLTAKQIESLVDYLTSSK